MGIKERIKLHDQCKVKLTQKGPHWGLYCDNPKCRKKDAWIQWIKQDTYRSLLNGK